MWALKWGRWEARSGSMKRPIRGRATSRSCMMGQRPLLLDAAPPALTCTIPDRSYLHCRNCLPHRASHTMHDNLFASQARLDVSALFSKAKFPARKALLSYRGIHIRWSTCRQIFESSRTIGDPGTHLGMALVRALDDWRQWGGLPQLGKGRSNRFPAVSLHTAPSSSLPLLRACLLYPLIPPNGSTLLCTSASTHEIHLGPSMTQACSATQL